MDSAKLILTEPVLPPVPLEHSSLYFSGKQISKCEPSNIDGVPESKKKQTAKDFESLLLNKLLDAMKTTIGDWGFEKDGTSKQVQGIFWLYLARDIANNGGFGMWKDIYQFLTDSDNTNTGMVSLDNNI